MSDDEYLSDIGSEEEEEEDVITVQKNIKPILPNSFGNTVINQNIIGDVDNEYESDNEEEDEDTAFDMTAGKSKSSSSGKTGKGRKRKNKKIEEENNSDYEDMEVPDVVEESDNDSDSDNAEEEDLNDQDYDEEDEEDNEGSMEGEEDETEKYMHQFNKEINKEYILETHPECIPVNMTEVRAMLNVVRNEDGVPIDDFHKTVPIVTKFEKARIIGQRASQLNSGATPYIEVPGAIDGSTIAEVEFNMKRIPVIIKRPLPNGAFEYWRLKDLEILY